MIGTPGLCAIHTPKAQVHDHLLRAGTRVLGQDGDLPQLLGHHVAVTRVAGEAARAHHQALLVHDGHAHLHAELVGLTGLSFSDALHFRRVQGIELVLRALAADALGALHQRLQIRQSGCTGFMAGLTDLALHLAQHNAQDRALALEHPAEALELPGVGVATRFAPQRPGLASLTKVCFEQCPHA